MPRLFWRRLATPISDEAPQRPLLLTVDEACRALRVSRWSLYRLIDSRRLSTIKIGARRLVPREELQRFIRDEQSGASL
ncbi:helix-turn-helix domain-containing protein [Amycolatopsis sp. NBC_01307]|uniref:helix-turn-helix domain-containing protein n=1 Tax=Amycolatopsis sp. NBC_01307 TaxID=2903561 RepID=UPI003FA3A35E